MKDRKDITLAEMRAAREWQKQTFIHQEALAELAALEEWHEIPSVTQRIVTAGPNSVTSQPLERLSAEKPQRIIIEIRVIP